MLKPDPKKILPPPLRNPKEALIDSDAAKAFIDGAAETPTVSTSPDPSAAPGRIASLGVMDPPWLDADHRYKQTVMVKMPEHEYMMLKWLAQTTYGASQTSIMLEAMRQHMDSLFAARGFSTGRDPDGTMRVDLPPQ